MTKFIHRYTIEKEYEESRIKRYKEPWLSTVEVSGTPLLEYNKSVINTAGHDYVDLGLPSGTLWAVCNIGGTTYLDYGRYYAWGDIANKTTYDSAAYRFGAKPYTKYNHIDGLTELELEDDIVHVQWGGDWHMPTREQLQELIDNTTMEYASVDPATGQSNTGIIFWSKTDPTKYLFFRRGGTANTSTSWSGRGYTLNLRSSTSTGMASADDYLGAYNLTAGKNLYGNAYANVAAGDFESGYSVRGVINK